MTLSTDACEGSALGGINASFLEFCGCKVSHESRRGPRSLQLRARRVELFESTFCRFKSSHTAWRRSSAVTVLDDRFDSLSALISGEISSQEVNADSCDS